MLCLCKKFGNWLPGLNHAAFCNPDFTCVKRPDAENLAQRFRAFNMVQENNMGWNIMIGQKLHMTDSNFTQLIIQILHFLTKFSQFHCFPRFQLSLFHCYTLFHCTAYSQVVNTRGALNICLQGREEEESWNFSQNLMNGG